jgi:hypothetical protein
LVNESGWQELRWDEQALFDPAGGIYRFDTHEFTITAAGDQLTLFIRGWKKWMNNGSGIFDIQEVSLVGPAPASLETALVQTAAVAPAETTMVEKTSPVEDGSADTAAQFASPSDETVATDSGESSASVDETVTDQKGETQTPGQAVVPADGPGLMLEPPVSTQPQASAAPLPVSGRGENDSIKYVIISGVALLLILFASAVTATARRRKQPE